MDLDTVPPVIRKILEQARVARLATSDTNMIPSIVPVCFTIEDIGGRLFFYTAIDAKPKKTEWQSLRRVRNICANPRVSILIDEYCEDWNHLSYVTFWGTAKMLINGLTRDRAEALLRKKYDQYKDYLEPGSPVISIMMSRYTSWGVAL